MNETIETLVNRRSIRQFTNEQISDEDLDLIVKAGTYAPTGRGEQSPIIVVVQDEKTICRLAKINNDISGVTERDPFYGALTVIVVLADASSSTCVEDGSLVIGNMMNAAASLGIGSCWVHRAKETFETEEGQELLKEWGIEGNYRGVGNCILGYTELATPEPLSRKKDYVYYVY